MQMMLIPSVLEDAIQVADVVKHHLGQNSTTLQLISMFCQSFKNKLIQTPFIQTCVSFSLF